MRLLDDVHLIESEILAPPIVSTFGERSINRAHLNRPVPHPLDLLGTDAYTTSNEVWLADNGQLISHSIVSTFTC